MYQKLARNNNERKVFSYIYDIDSNFTILDISTTLNITFPTTKRIISLLIKNNIVNIENKIANPLGRKSISYSYNHDCFFGIGIKISYDNISFILSNTKGKIYKSYSFKFKIENSNIVNVILENLLNFIHGIEKKYFEKILGIGISIPGVVMSSSNLLELTENIKIPLDSFNIIYETTKIPVLVENESNLSSIAETFLNPLDNYKNFNVVTINENIGLCTFQRDEISDSIYFKAGKIQHMLITDDESKLCSCGNTGCLGLYVSDLALLKEFVNVFPEITEYSEIFVNEYYKTEKGKQILENYLKYLARGLKNILNFSNPEKILISGQIANYTDIIEEPLKKLFYAKGHFYCKGDVIAFSRFKEKSSLLGAALFPIVDRIF